MASYTGGGISTVSAPTGPAGGSLTGSYPNPTLSSAATGTTQSFGDNSTKFATTAYADAGQIFQHGVFGTNPDLIPSSSGASAVSTLLLPTFTPIRFISPRYAVSQLAVFVGTGVGGATVGAAVYSIAYSGAGTFTATLVCQLNAATATTSSGTKKGDVTTGAVGSGATVSTLNAATTQYVIGVMASTVTTLTLRGVSGQNGWGLLAFSGAGNGVARGSVTDWPASFDQTYAGASTSRHNWSALVNADGKNWL